VWLRAEVTWTGRDTVWLRADVAWTGRDTVWLRAEVAWPERDTVWLRALSLAVNMQGGCCGQVIAAQRLRCVKHIKLRNPPPGHQQVPFCTRPGAPSPLHRAGTFLYSREGNWELYATSLCLNLTGAPKVCVNADMSS
jgi:hypothetical protein